MTSLFVSDLHGSTRRYDRLFESIKQVLPKNVFVCGDVFPHRMNSQGFIAGYLRPQVKRLQEHLREHFPLIYLILGNDDPRAAEPELLELESQGLCIYCHGKRANTDRYVVIGYNYIPPTPFQLKDWERYDVSRYVDPGCTPPDEGETSVDLSETERKWSTIASDLDKLTENVDLTNAILMFHSPPYDTQLDRAALDGQSFEGIPLDLHVGSIAIRRFIEKRQPMLTLHGHVHESTRLTGTWRQKIGRTHCMNAAHDGPELSVIRFKIDELESAERILI